MTDRRRRAALVGTLLSTLLLGVVQLSAGPADEDDRTAIGEVRTAMEIWAENRRLIAEEKRDWTLGRELLLERIEVVRGEIESLQERIDDAQDDIAEADETRVELQEQNDELKVSSTALAGIIDGLEARTKALLVRLPEPLIDRVRPLSQRFPDDPKTTRLSLSERFATVIGVLNAINKFNRGVTVTSEVRALPDGTTAEVAAVYVGIGQAYYANALGTAGGVGTGSADGWVWTSANEHAAAILEVLAILESESPAAFVALPMEVE